MWAAFLLGAVSHSRGSARGAAVRLGRPGRRFPVLLDDGLVAELQRSESFSLSKFLHLPVSVNGAFLLNYLSSLLRLSLVFFTPVMLGFALALVYVKGILFLPVLPSVAAFLLMITGLTYQFQGWLAALMTNPRHRRSVVVAATAFFILITQLPNAINLLAPWGAQRQADRYARLVEQIKPEPVPPPGQINVIEFQRRQEEIKKRFQNAADQANRESDENLKRVARLTNLLLPVGWLPLGVFSAAEGRILPAILGLLGMGAIGNRPLAVVSGHGEAVSGRVFGPEEAAHRRGPCWTERVRPGGFSSNHDFRDCRIVSR